MEKEMLEEKEMNEKVVVITGANSGIGKAATIRFAENGFSVVMACRYIKRSKAIQEQIISTTGNLSVDLMELDTSSFQSIRNFYASFCEKYEKLDILIHNAAYLNHGHPYRLSADQIELTFATNVFGPHLLSMLFRNELKKSDDPRILHAGSNIIKNFFNPGLKTDFSHLFEEDKTGASFSVYKSYRDSKMVFLMLTIKMAEELRLDGIKVNMLEISGAKMSKETLQKFKPRYRLIAYVQNLFFPTTEKVAELYYSICTSNEFSEMTGRMFNHKLHVMQPGKENPDGKDQVTQLLGSEIYPRYAHDQETIEKVWQLCKQVTGE
jgi:NAD(P)-dependent dehydrogenase (short-subunit alcohol dehydrogenase family)